MRVKSNKPTPPDDGTVKALGTLVQRNAGEPSDKAVFRITSEVLDRHSDRVKTSGLNVERYLKNPVLLWNHQDWSPAIGTARVFQENGEWFMEPTFDGIGELSKEVGAKVAAGTLRTCSIRFKVHKYTPNEEGGLDYEDIELLENSITNIPANHEAERVKKNGQQQPQKSGTTPADGVESKALEQADLEAVQACVAEALQPVMELLQSLAAQLEALAAKSRNTDEEPEKDEGGAGGEDEEELKAFFARSGVPAKKK